MKIRSALTGKSHWLLFGASLAMLVISAIIAGPKVKAQVIVPIDPITVYDVIWSPSSYEQFAPWTGIQNAPEPERDAKKVFNQIDGWLVDGTVRVGPSGGEGSGQWTVKEHWKAIEYIRHDGGHDEHHKDAQGNRYCRGRFESKNWSERSSEGAKWSDAGGQQHILAMGNTVLCTEENDLNVGQKVRGTSRSIITKWKVSGVISPVGTNGGNPTVSDNATVIYEGD